MSLPLPGPREGLEWDTLPSTLPQLEDRWWGGPDGRTRESQRGFESRRPGGSEDGAWSGAKDRKSSYKTFKGAGRPQTPAALAERRLEVPGCSWASGPGDSGLRGPGTATRTSQGGTGRWTRGHSLRGDLGSDSAISQNADSQARLPHGRPEDTAGLAQPQKTSGQVPGPCCFPLVVRPHPIQARCSYQHCLPLTNTTSRITSPSG